MSRSALLFWLKLAAAVAAAAALLVMPQLRLATVHTAFYDLGQYTTTIDAVAFGGEAGQAFSGHAHLAMPLYAAIYRLFPGAATLIGLQSFVLVVTAALAGWLWRRAGAGPALDGILVYLLSISVWFNAIFDFHFEHLLFPLMFGAASGILIGGRRGMLIALLCGLAFIAVKEAYTLSAVGVGLTLIASRRWWVAGSLLIVAGLLAFFGLTGTVIAYYSGGQQSGSLWNSAFGYLGASPGEMLTTMLARPLDVLAEMLRPRKLLYVAVLGAAFGALWLRAPALLLPGAPILLLSLLSRNENHFYLGNHYTAGVVAPLFAATAIGIGRLPLRLRGRVTAGVLVASALVLVAFGPSPVSRLYLQDASFSFGRLAYWPTSRDRWVRDQIEAKVPAGDPVSVSAQNTVFISALGRRRNLAAFPAGVFRPFVLLAPHRIGLVPAIVDAFERRGETAPVERLDAGYVVIDRKREWYLADQGCRWAQGACTDAASAQRYEEAVARLLDLYDPVFDEDGLLILRRRQP